MSEKPKETGIFGHLWATFFAKHWPVWVGAVILGALNIVLFAINSPWGASGGINNWGENLYGLLGFSAFEGTTPMGSSIFAMLALMLIVGSFIGALFSKEFALRVPPKGEMAKGFIGGGLMAIGATVGLGCTVASFFSGVPALSGGAIIFTVGLFVGVIVALKYLMWEMERFPMLSSGKSYTWLAAKPAKGKTQVYIGWVVFALILILSYTYAPNNPIMSWYIIIGLLMGLISQRSRFCIVKAFRDPFMTGEASGATGIIAGMVVTLFGFTAIKYFGIGIGDAGIRTQEMTWVFSHFWAKALIGGFIFGLGMTVAGGCAAGTLWRVGEGQVKLWFSALAFILIMPLSNKAIVPLVNKIIPHQAGFKMFLPDYIGYSGAFGVVVCILLIWYWFVKWNEKTGRFTAY